MKLLRIEFPRGKTSIRRHPEIITNCGFRMLLRIKYFLGITSIRATLGPRNWATWRSWAAFPASDDPGLKFSLEETQFWATPGFATLEAPWRLRLRLRRDIFPSWLGPPTSAQGMPRSTGNHKILRTRLQSEQLRESWYSWNLQILRTRRQICEIQNPELYCFTGSHGQL